MIHQKSGGKKSWDLIYWVLLNYRAAWSAGCEAEAGWISMSEAVMSMNWETHWLTESFPGPPAHPSTPREPGWAGWDESQSRSEPAVILYKTYTEYFCWLLRDISKVAGKPGHLLHGLQINRKRRGEQVEWTCSGEDRTPSKAAQLSSVLTSVLLSQLLCSPWQTEQEEKLLPHQSGIVRFDHCE